MDMYPQYKSPLGYTNGDNKIDAYGVDHSGFSAPRAPWRHLKDS